MMMKTVVITALTAGLAIGLASTSSAGDRKEMREKAGVEAGDRVDRRSEVRESVD